MWCHVMKSSDLVSKAKHSVPPHYHPPESPVVGCSDSTWKWPQDGERFQVTSAWNLRHMWKYLLPSISEFCMWDQRAVQNTNAALPLIPSCSYWVQHIIGDLRRLVVTDWNDSTQYQLWRAHGSSYAFPALRHECQHLMERPCHPTAQVQEHCRGAFLPVFKNFVHAF